MRYLKEVAVRDKEAREKAAAAAKEKEEKIRLRKKTKSFRLVCSKSLSSFAYVLQFYY